jgi:hypothetical protein
MTTLKARDARGLIYSGPAGQSATFVVLPWSRGSRGYGWRIDGDKRRPRPWFLLGDMCKLARALGCDSWETVGTEAAELSTDEMIV